MKRAVIFLIYFTLVCHFVRGQESEGNQESSWEFNPALNFYFFRDDFFVLPVFKADKNALHLEARYNYEDRETFSGWIGYNFSGGENFQFNFTPMVGGVVGLTNGVAPSLETTLAFKKFELYTESEYLINFESNEDNFFYTWTDFTYSPKDWLWFGISGQRIRAYQTDLDIQRGLLVGASIKRLEVSTYLYNLGFDNPFILVTLEMGF